MASTSASGSKGKEEIIDAFDELAPSPPPSVSNSTKKASYDVFINHCGQDVKATLASVLYGLLTREKLSVFLDKKELESGGYFPEALKEAMDSALVHIAIFSENYAKSAWCLAELSHMLKSGTQIIPIFYKVDTSDLRYVKGKYGEAFNEYVQKNRYLRRLEEWKEALHKVSFYKGEIIKNVVDDFGQLKDIVDTVLKIKQKKVPLPVADHPVGMEDLVKQFEMKTIQSVEGDHGVGIIGIWGMGGLGKTTLAKEIYNRKSSLFKRSSIVYNVRDGGLVEKQKKILKDSGFEENIGNIEEGKEKLSSCLRSVKAFIVLDDVDHVNQLDALLPAKDILASGSLIIVTTRDHSVLDSRCISCVYKMEALNPLDARELFCWYAFEQVTPWDGFEGLVEKVVKACHRVPLSLKVIGREICKEPNKKCWDSLLQKIGTTLPTDIQQTLKISYDSLDDQEKKMFLDVACFFIGEKKSSVIEIWDGLEWNGFIGLKRLVNKCLLKLDDKDFISMHDHLRDMGRSIAKNQSPYRFWIPQPIINVQIQNQVVHSGSSSTSICPCLMSALTVDFHKKIQEIIGIQGILATSYQIQWIDHLVKEPVPKMCGKKDEVDESKVWCSHGELMVDTNCGIWPLSPALVGLKFLVTSGNSFNQIIGEVSRNLVWLRWFEIGQRSLALGVSWKKLRVLELYEGWTENHLEELWGETEGEAPVQLRELLVSRCYKFQGFPKSIGYLKFLKKIVITDTSNIRSLPDEFCLLKSLEHLVLPESKMLSLPSNFGNLSSLRHLNLSHSSELRTLPVSFKNLTLLEYLNLSDCSQLKIKSEELDCLQNITKLEYLSLECCFRVEEWPDHIANNVSLRELHFGRTSLRKLPDNIGQLSKLREMWIENLSTTSLPTSLGGLSSLTKLCIYSSVNLEHLPESLGDLSSLTTLEIVNCPKLDRLGEKSVPQAVKKLSSLQSLRISDCPISGSSLSFGASNLKYISLWSTEVCRILFSEDCCPNLKDFLVDDNHHLEEIEGLPSTLDIIYMGNCEMLKKMSSFATLTSLRIFHLQGCNRLEKIEGLENCIGLRGLIVESRMEVPGIASLERLQNLRKLELSANKGPVIERCIQRMQEWPPETKMCAWAALEAVSVVESLQLSPSLMIVDSISNHKLKSSRPKLVQKYGSSNGDALMLCFVINCVSSKMELGTTICGKTAYPRNGAFGYAKVEKGRWAWIGVFTPHSDYSSAEEFYLDLQPADHRRGEIGEEDELEKGLVVRGEEQALLEAVRSLLPRLLQS